MAEEEGRIPTHAGNEQLLDNKEKHLAPRSEGHHKYDCSRCSRSFDNRAQMQEHFAFSHAFSAPPASDHDHTVKPKTKVENVHLTAKTDVKEHHKYDCSRCSRRFDNRAQMQEHFAFSHAFAGPPASDHDHTVKPNTKVQNVHLTAKTNPQEHHTFQCSRCPRAFDCRANMQDHFALAHAFEK